ncbi:glycosyltransferase family 2 protein [candidate division WWE3 bacterium]|nr:glycosyltransferase family 2 protein [candidate division WWE3 bacterium]
MIQKHEKKIYRFFEILPGVLVWAILLSPVWLGLLAPKIVFFYITFLTIYWAYLATRHTYGGIVGYRRYQEEMKVDWMLECEKLDFLALPDKDTLPPSLEETKHFILIPMYSETKEILKSSFESLLAQTYPLRQITLVLTMEEKYSSRLKSDILEILGENIAKFEEVLFYVHPSGIEDEAKGVAGANRTWGAKNGVGHLRQKDVNIRNYIFSTFDSDSVLDRQFIARVTHLYLTNDKRDYKYFGPAVNLFNNNIWDVPMLMRIEANSIVIACISDAVVSEPEFKETFSCYSASLQTLIDANYWDVQVGVDDTIFYWRSFFARGGDFIGVHHFIPYSADAVQGSDYLKSHKSMYLQLRRWAWGTIVVPISMTEFFKKNKIPLIKKIRWTVLHFERRVLLITLVFLMTFGISILTKVNQDARQISLVYTLPNLISTILTFTLIFFVPITILRAKLVKPMPKEWFFLKKVFFTLVEGPMVIINMLTFSLIPYLDAYTRMLLGNKMSDLYHTPKVRSK